MKKIFSVVLVITLIFLLTSCGKPKELKELEKLSKALNKLSTEEGINSLNEFADSFEFDESDDGYGSDYDYDSDDDYDDTYSYDDDYSYDDNSYDDDGDIEYIIIPGSELSGFYAYFNESLTAFEASVNKWETDDFFLFDAVLDYLSPSLHLVTMGLYDSLEFFGYDEGEYKEVTGNIVKYGKEFIRSEDGFSPNDKEGDLVVEKGILDTSARTLSYESYTKRDGELVTRAVTEVVALSDGTFVVQTISKAALYDDRLEDKGDAYFMVFDSNRLEVIKAKFSPDVNFNYNSIIGKGNMTVDDMAQGYVLIRKMTVADGVANVETY